jgi:hypothetical protein
MTFQDILSDLTRQRDAAAAVGQLALVRQIDAEIARVERIEAAGGSVEEVKCATIRLSYR